MLIMNEKNPIQTQMEIVFNLSLNKSVIEFENVSHLCGR